MRGSFVWGGLGGGLEGGEGCGLGVSGCVYSTLYPTLSGDGTAGRGWGTRTLRGVGDGGGVGREEVVEQAGETAAAVLGGGGGDGFGVLGRGQLGDGSDGAEVGVEDELFDDVFWMVGVIGGGGASAGGGAAAVAAGAAGGAGFVEVPDGQFEGVEDGVGALGVELRGGEAGENLGDGEVDALAVVDGGELKDGVLGADPAVAGGGAAGGVVVVAELLAVQRGRTAAAARGEDVTALKALGCGFRGWNWVGRCGFGCVRHRVPPPGGRSVKYSKNVS